MPSRHDLSDPQASTLDAALVVSRMRDRRAALRRDLIHAGIWLLGAAGFLVPLVLSRTSPRADLLRAFALGWFILFGVINGLFVLRARPRPRGRRNL